MPMNVGESFLHHAQDCPLQFRGKIVDLLRNADPGNEAGAPGEAFGEVPQGGLQAVICQIRRVQQIREYPQFSKRLPELLVDLCERITGDDGCNDRLFEPFERQLRSHEVLRCGIRAALGLCVAVLPPEARAVDPDNSLTRVVA